MRGEGKREGEGRKRGRGVSVVDVSECPTQSLQQDLETQPHMCSQYPLHVLLFTMTSWSNSICYTSLSPQGVDISSVSYHILTLDMLVRTAAMPTCMRYQSSSLSHSSAADEAWYWLKCIQCSSSSACTLSERCVLLVVPA